MLSMTQVSRSTVGASTLARDEAKNFTAAVRQFHTMALRKWIVLLAALLPASPACAAVSISLSATENMSCSAGVCVPTAKDAVLNAGDLETLLASGSVEVTTTGNGVQAGNLDVNAAVSWTVSSTLTLDAYGSITVEQPLSVGGVSGVSLVTNDGGTGGLLLFLGKGDTTFANLSSGLSINGSTYTLVGTLPDLAAAIAANPSGSYGLANSYDASRDRAYSNAPIPTAFTGNFNGLGNTISNLRIRDKAQYNGVNDALFSVIGTGGTVASIGVVNADIVADGNYVAGIAGINDGTVTNAWTSGSFEERSNNTTWPAAGLVDWNFGGTVMLSHADAEVTVVSPQNSAAGLVGDSTGSIVGCYATGSVAVTERGGAGGLAGGNSGTIEDSYAIVSVKGREGAGVGGLIGANDGAPIARAYSAGAVRDRLDKLHQGYKGGFVGDDSAHAGSMTDAYWDTTTSGQRHGAGFPKDDPGITGMTTAQLQSGLPKGFDPKVWAEDAKINGGLPYLIDNPPQK